MFLLNYFLPFYWIEILTCVTIWGVLQLERRWTRSNDKCPCHVLTWGRLSWLEIFGVIYWKVLVDKLSLADFLDCIKTHLWHRKETQMKGRKIDKIIKITAWSVWRGMWTSERTDSPGWLGDATIMDSGAATLTPTGHPQSLLLSIIPQYQILTFAQGSGELCRVKAKPWNDFKEGFFKS